MLWQPPIAAACITVQRPGGRRYGTPVQLREIMTTGVVTASLDASAAEVAQRMRDHNVGSVVIVEPDGLPIAMVTDRDLATRVLAEDADPGEPIDELASRPLVSADPETELEEAAALMVQHRVRRLPVVEAGELTGIVTLDDIAVRTGNLEVAQRMTQEVIEGALPQFFFHERG
jgi:CBS domain-containing protein